MTNLFTFAYWVYRMIPSKTLRLYARHIYRYVKFSLHLLGESERTTPLNDFELKEIRKLKYLCRKSKFNFFAKLGTIMVLLFFVMGIFFSSMFFFGAVFSLLFVGYGILIDFKIREMIKKEDNDYLANKEAYDAVSRVNYLPNNGNIF